VEKEASWSQSRWNGRTLRTTFSLSLLLFIFISFFIFLSLFLSLFCMFHSSFNALFLICVLFITRSALFFILLKISSFIYFCSFYISYLCNPPLSLSFSQSLVSSCYFFWLFLKFIFYQESFSFISRFFN